MTDEIESRLTRARTFLAQVTGLDPVSHAEAIIHLAYYAMYHAALAVVQAHTGETPFRHGAVVNRFGLVVKDMDEPARAAGEILHSSFNARVVADYGVEHGTLSPSAVRIRSEAAEFVQLCERLVRR